MLHLVCDRSAHTKSLGFAPVSQDAILKHSESVLLTPIVSEKDNRMDTGISTVHPPSLMDVTDPASSLSSLIIWLALFCLSILFPALPSVNLCLEAVEGLWLAEVSGGRKLSRPQIPRHKLHVRACVRVCDYSENVRKQICIILATSRVLSNKTSPLSTCTYKLFTDQKQINFQIV